MALHWPRRRRPRPPRGRTWDSETRLRQIIFLHKAFTSSRGKQSFRRATPATNGALGNYTFRGEIGGGGLRGARQSAVFEVESPEHLNSSKLPTTLGAHYWRRFLWFGLPRSEGGRAQPAAGLLSLHELEFGEATGELLPLRPDSPSETSILLVG